MVSAPLTTVCSWAGVNGPGDLGLREFAAKVKLEMKWLLRKGTSPP